MILQIATALAIGAYVVLSKDAQSKRPNPTPRESFQHPAAHLDREEAIALREAQEHQKASNPEAYFGSDLQRVLDESPLAPSNRR
jgi:hypothetical protein